MLFVAIAAARYSHRICQDFQKLYPTTTCCCMSTTDLSRFLRSNTDACRTHSRLFTQPATVTQHELHSNQRRLSTRDSRPTARPATRNHTIHKPIQVCICIWVRRKQQERKRSEEARRQRLAGSTRVEDRPLGKRGREDLPPGARLQRLCKSGEYRAVVVYDDGCAYRET